MMSFETDSVKRVPVRTPVHPLSTPIYSSSTFVLESAAHGALLCSEGSKDIASDESSFLYSRHNNPTTDVAARTIAKLEGGHAALVTSSGMAAISTTLFTFLKAGDHVVATNTIYGGTYELLTTTMPSLNIEVTFVDGTKSSEYKSAMKENTRLFYAESPANPTMSIQDLKEIATIAHGEEGREANTRRRIVTVVDSTFASPFNQRPLEYGFDVVVHSATKYLGGHSDLLGGCVVVKTEEHFQKLTRTQILFGNNLSPFDAFLLIRGLKTLAVRMKRHNKNAMKVARFLQSHDAVEVVHYPGLASHPQHTLATSQMSGGYGGMVSFEVKGGSQAGQILIENLNVIVLAVSLGGTESLIEQASTMTHKMMPKEDRMKADIADGLLRLSVGLESPTDLINDLAQALDLAQVK